MVSLVVVLGLLTLTLLGCLALGVQALWRQPEIRRALRQGLTELVRRCTPAPADPTLVADPYVPKGEHDPRPAVVRATRRRRRSLKEDGLLITPLGTLAALARLHDRLATRWAYAVTRVIVVSPTMLEVLEGPWPGHAAQTLAQLGLRLEVRRGAPRDRVGVVVTGPRTPRTVWLRTVEPSDADLRRLGLGEMTEAEVLRRSRVGAAA